MRILMTVFFILTAGFASAAPKSYPLHGTVTAVHDRVTSEAYSYQQGTGVMSRTGQLPTRTLEKYLQPPLEPGERRKVRSRVGLSEFCSAAPFARL